MALTFEEYQTLVEQAPIMIWRSNASAECDYFNHRWLQFRGRTIAQELGNGWAEGVHSEDMDLCMKTYLDAFKKREPFEMRYRLRRGDGQYRWIFDRGAPFHDAQGHFAGFIGSCIDVTEQVKADKILTQRREKELDQLRGLLPICCYCKKIRNDRDEWLPLEQYIEIHSNADFSHGICPTCVLAFKREPKKD